MADDLHEDPMDAIRANYVRHQRQPLGRIVSALRAAGAHAVPARSELISHEVVHQGMCIGFVRKGDGVSHLEMSRTHSPPDVLAAVTLSIETAQRTAGMQAAQAGMAMAGR